MFERIGLTQDARDTVEFLIANHLAMSQVAFRRDTEDPEIVRKFAELVGVEERLKMLCLLTLADVEAVSTETLTPWRAELLWRLYVDTYNHLTLGYGDELHRSQPGGHAELLANRPADLPRDRHRRFLEGPAAPLPAALRQRGHLPARAARARHPSGRGRSCGWRKGFRLGTHRRHARQAVSLLEHFRCALVVRHGHPARPRHDQARTAWSWTCSNSPTRNVSSS